jgi:hypothetical protein
VKEHFRYKSLSLIVVLVFAVAWMLFPNWFKPTPAHAVTRVLIGPDNQKRWRGLGDNRIQEGEEKDVIVQRGHLRLSIHGKGTLKFDPPFKRDPSCGFPNSGYVKVLSHTAEKYELEGHALARVNYECQGVKRAE